MPPADSNGFALERFRGQLLLLAQLNWHTKLRGLVDPSDVVQQTLLEAHEKRNQYHGKNEAQLGGWLRRSLANNIADAVRQICRQKRDRNLERSLEVAIEDSSSRVERFLAADESSPSERAARNERLDRMVVVLAKLPEAQREAVVLHHLQGLSLDELAAYMGRSQPAVAGLLRRGLKQLRELMIAQD
jgi:RNA polymerase sigma-70 factor, ECF subfamily